MEKFKELSKEALEKVGGLDNITFVTHCATRLRISYKDKDKVDMAGLNAIEGVSGLVNKQGQVQLIIGPQVNDVYHAFLEVSGWKESADTVTGNKPKEKKNVLYFLNNFGNFAAPIFMPIIPAMVVGGLILAIRTLLVNYFGMSSDSGTAQMMMSLFTAGFTFMPVYIGFSYAKQLKMQPIMGAFLGAVMICDRFTSGTVTDFFGIPVPQISYGSTVIPIILGVTFMYFVDKVLKKITPDIIVYFVKPLVTMIIVVPVTLIVLGPLGSELSGYVGNFFVWIMDHLGFLALPLMSIAQPYMVMFGIDKALNPISVQLLTELGYNPLTSVSGFISNLCIGATALAVALSLKDKKQKGMLTGTAITALCGVTEPAFYGGLIMRPKVLLGTAIGATAGGIVGYVLSIRTYIMGACPGLLTFLNFIDPNTGSLHYVWVAVITCVVSIVVSFIATWIIIKNDKSLTEQEVKKVEME